MAKKTLPLISLDTNVLIDLPGDCHGGVDPTAREKQVQCVVDAALAGEAQRVTRFGQPMVVVLAADEYERLCRLEKSDAPTLGDLLLEIPQDDREFERLCIPARSLDS